MSRSLTLMDDDCQALTDSPSPFLLKSRDEMPMNLITAMDYCRFLYHATPMYRAVSKRVVGHFVTRLDFRGEIGSPKERLEFSRFFEDDLGGLNAVRLSGEHERCLAAATQVVCEDGIYPISELAGKTVSVLSKGGVYRQAEFKAFGIQELYEVTFTDGRSIYATAEHEWEVRNCSGKMVRVPTTSLHKRNAVVRTVAPRPERNEEYMEGVRHGFIFGDGHIADRRVKNPKSRASFYGEKDAALLPFFEGHGNPPRRSPSIPTLTTQSGFSGTFKTLPAATASASYWYGFVSGFFAADGNVDKRDGCAVLTQKSGEVLEAVVAQLPRIGMCAGPIHSREAWVILPKQTVPKPQRMHRVMLLRRFMQAEDFLIAAHRANFVANSNPDSDYGRSVSIKSVRPTGRVEEVYCCVEPQTHTFVVGNGILTGNCFGNDFTRVHFPFVRTLVDRRKDLRLYNLSMFPEELVKFNLQEMTYGVPDPVRSDLPADKRPIINLTFRDTPGKEFSRIRIRHLDPRYCKLRYSETSGRTQVQYSFVPEMKARIRRGVLHEVNETPLAMLQAIRDNRDYLFDEGAIYHLKNPAIVGLSKDGWGIPEILAQFPNIHKIAVYDRIDEAVGADYMMPMRILAPNLAGLGENRNHMIADEWVPAVRRMISEQRKDRTRIHGFPFPFVYQELGGQGKALSPKDVKQFEVQNLLNCIGYPLELLQGSLALQQMPAAIRLFESSHSPLKDGLSGLARWAIKKITNYMYGEAYEAYLWPSSVADDIERRSLIFNLYSAGEIPRRVAFDGLALSDEPNKLKVERAKEDAEQERELAELQAEEQRRAQLGSLNDLLTQQGDGAQGSTQGGSPAMTPTDLRSQAEQLAQQWRAIPEDGKRTQAMMQVRSVNPDLYSVAKDVLDQMRRQDASAGRAQGNQMAAQQNPQTAQPPR